MYSANKKKQKGSRKHREIKMSLKAGISSVDITPPVGVYLTGFGNRREPSIGVKLPLKAKYLVLKDEKEKVAIISADLIGPGKKVTPEKNGKN